MLLRTIYRDREKRRWVEDISHVYVDPLGRFQSEMLAKEALRGYRWQLLRDARRHARERRIAVTTAVLIESPAMRRAWYLYVATPNSKTLDFSATFFSRESAEAWLLKEERKLMQARWAERWAER